MKNILIISISDDAHVHIVLPWLNKEKVAVYRFDTDLLGTKQDLVYLNGQLILRNRKNEVDVSTIDTVWYRKPIVEKPLRGIRDLATQLAIEENKEALMGLVQLLPQRVFWVNSPNNNRIADSKMYQLRVARELGFSTPDTMVTNNYKQALDFYLKNNKKCIVKSLVGSVSLGVYYGGVETTLLDDSNIEDLKRINYSPVIIQPNVPKKFELRITVIGSKVFAVKLDTQKLPETSLDWRGYTSKVPHEVYTLPTKLEEKIVEFVRYFQLNFSALDFIVTPDGEYVFLENNPNGQFLWMERMLPQLKMAEAMADLLAYHK